MGPGIKLIIGSLTLLTMLITSIPTSAQPAGKDQNDWRLSLEFANATEANVSGDRGEVSVAGGRFSATYRYYTFSYSRREYSWGNQENLPFGNGVDDPFNGMNKLDLGIRYPGKINEKWRYIVGGGVNSSFEQEMSDSFGARAFALFSYGLTPKWRLALGAFGRYNPVRSLAMPAFGVSYNQFAPLGLSFALGYPLTHITYKFTPQIALKYRMVQFDQFVYRLADDSTVQPGGYIETQDMMTGLTLEWRPAKNWDVNVGANYYFRRLMTFYDEDGENEKEWDVDEAWGGVLRIRYSF